MDMDLFIVKFWKIHGREEKSKSISHREEEEVTFWPDFTFYTSTGWRERNKNNKKKRVGKNLEIIVSCLIVPERLSQ